MTRGSLRSLALTLIVPAIAAFLVYLPALPGGFLSDDYSEVRTFFGLGAPEVLSRVAKTFVSGVGPPSNQYRPLTMASFAANLLVDGANPYAWRLTNLLLHAANAALVALLAWQLAGRSTRHAQTAAVAAGLAFAWFAPSVEAVAWIAARFDLLALFWILVAANAFVRRETWRDRYGLASLAASALAYMSKESAAIGVPLILALSWQERPAGEGALQAGVRAIRRAIPWLALAAGYFALRAAIFGDPFRFFPGSSPGMALLSGHWLAALAASGPWWAQAVPEDGLRQAYTIAGLLLAIAATAAALAEPRAKRLAAALALAWLAAIAMLFSHWSWSASGEGGRVLYPIAAIAAIFVALPLRAQARNVRLASWALAAVLLGTGLALTHFAVERRAQAGAQMLALIAALRETAEALPKDAYAFVVVPDHLGSIPFARNAQGGMMSPPVQPRPLSPRLVVQLPDELPRWPELLARNIIGRLKNEPLAAVTADPRAPGTAWEAARPDHFYCWNAHRRVLVGLPISFAPGYRDWDAVWARALGAAGCAT